MKELLKQVIFDQKKRIHGKKITRLFPQSLIDCQEVLIISGVRRCGKSVLLQQIRKNQPEKDYYFNFDDDRLVLFNVGHFQLLFEVFIELFGKQNTFYFDEIQNINGWELFVRRLYDNGCKVYTTGSNANMLSRELGTHLTGRYCSFELYPFSFHEYLDLQGVQVQPEDFYTTEGTAGLSGLFEKYLSEGGFPQYILSKNPDYLKSLVESIIYKDVLVRNKITNEREMMELVHYLASHVSGLVSYNGLTDVVGVKHPATLKNYIRFNVV